MAKEGFLANLEGSSDDSKPATKKDAKKDKHLQVVGIVVGVLAIYLGYRWYQNRQASAATTTTTTSVPTTTPSASDLTGTGSGGGYGRSGTQATNENNLATIASTDAQILAALQNQNAGSTTNNYTTNYTTTTPSSTSTSTVTGNSNDNAYASYAPLPLSSGVAATPRAITAPTGSNLGGPTGISPAAANALVSSGALSPQAALQSETPAASETNAQRHAQEVANRGLRAQAKA